eukprot:2522450-Prymnesium_polylepis.1
MPAASSGGAKGALSAREQQGPFKPMAATGVVSARDVPVEGTGAVPALGSMARAGAPSAAEPPAVTRRGGAASPLHSIHMAGACPRGQASR